MNLSRSMRGSNSSLNSLKNFKENMNAARSLSWSEMKRDSYSLCSFNLADGVKKIKIALNQLEKNVLSFFDLLLYLPRKKLQNSTFLQLQVYCLYLILTK